MSAHPTPTQRTEATPPAPPHVQHSDFEALVGPVGIWMVIASLAFIAGGIAWPQAAEALLRIFLVTVALIIAAGRAYQAVGAVRPNEDLYSPFDPHAAAWTPPVAPQALRKLTAELDAVANARGGGQAVVPLSVRQTVHRELARRLAEHHGLSVAEPLHHPRIRSLVSESTWQLIRSHDSEVGRGPGQPARVQPVLLSQLGLILDDLESL